jgi:hypothetical protein
MVASLTLQLSEWAVLEGMLDADVWMLQRVQPVMETGCAAGSRHKLPLSDAQQGCAEGGGSEAHQHFDQTQVLGQPAKRAPPWRHRFTSQPSALLVT